MLKLKLQYFGHLMRRANSLDKTLLLGNIEERRRRGWQRMRWLDGSSNTMDVNLSKLWETVRAGKPGVLQSIGLQRVGHDWVPEQQEQWLWRLSSPDPRRTNDRVLIQVWWPEDRRADVVGTSPNLSPKTGEVRCPSLKTGREPPGWPGWSHRGL